MNEELAALDPVVTAIHAILAADERSSDAELVARFVAEFGISEEQARAHVTERDELLSGIPCVHN